MAEIRRPNTAEIAFMENKATVFNEAINSQRRLWEVIMSENINNFIGILGDNIESSDCTIVDLRNPQNVVTRISNEPKIYYLGGAAYASYNRMITENGGADIFRYAPRTHDWDTSFVLKKKDDIMMNNIERNLLDYFRNNYARLNENNYIESTFEQINKKPELDQKHKEELVGLVGPKDKECIEITRIVKGGRGGYENIRVNLVKRIKDTYAKNHICEFVFWFGKTRQEYINSTVKLIYNDTTYYLPKLFDLLKSNLESLKNRSKNPDAMAKCRQDYLRITNFIQSINSVRQIIPTLVEDLTYVTEYLEKIRPYVPQCIDELDRETFESLQKNLKHMGRSKKFDNVQRLIQTYYDYYIERIHLERQINKMTLLEALNPENMDVVNVVNVVNVVDDVDEEADRDARSDVDSYYAKKYLKYKQKYLNSISK
jgi:hypothetical protein